MERFRTGFRRPANRGHRASDAEHPIMAPVDIQKRWVICARGPETKVLIRDRSRSGKVVSGPDKEKPCRRGRPYTIALRAEEPSIQLD